MSRIISQVVFLLMAIQLSSPALSQDSATVERLATQALEIQEKRCMVCHGCYDAPCQLKLEASVGLNRGASKAKVYNGSRLITGEMTRLFDDGYTQEQWRNKGFYPVLDKQHPGRGVMYRMLDLKKANPMPSSGAISTEFDFSLNRSQQCPKPEEFNQYAKDYPLWGMPYGLPGLIEDEQQLMMKWLEQGAPTLSLPPLSDSLQSRLKKWEAFLNGTSNKERLMSRYLYEHLYLAGIYLEQGDNPVWFRLVRSYTQPGRNLGLISTRRPFDDPKTGTFYYRLQRMPVSILDKRHMPYIFDQKRMNWYRQLFLSPDYEVAELPGYGADMVANPFKRFQSMPAKSRYRFMLEEAQFSIMNFIKGPVCRGQIALSVIDDHFWIMFSNPEISDPELNAKFLAREVENLRLPTAVTGTPIDLFRWRRYAKAEQQYSAARAEYALKAMDHEQRGLNVEDIWDGDGNNDNAALTIFRHFDTASVVKGFVGTTPKTAWVITYPLLERIHYLLVAGFDVYGGASHQLESRLYMDFLRMEGEYNFLMFLPTEVRHDIRNFWYRDAQAYAKEHYFNTSETFQRNSDVVFKTDDPKTEFLQRLRKKLYGAQAEPYDYRLGASSDMIKAFERLESHTGSHNSFMPQVSFVNVIGKNRDQAYTIIRNSAYSNITQLFKEEERRLPEEDSLTVARGFIGAYPNSFFQVNESEVPKFVEEIASFQEASDGHRFLNRYGVRRNAPWFWRISDKFHDMYREKDGIAAGIFDYNRYHAQ